MALPVIATAVSAIPELIDDGLNGKLVPPSDFRALAAAMTDLIRQPATRVRYAAAGRGRVLTAFTVDAGLDALAARFGIAGKSARPSQREQPSSTNEPVGRPDAA